MQQTIQSILREHRLFGFRDPSWHIWAASRLTQEASATAQAGKADAQSAWALFVASNLLRQAAAFSPYDRDLFRLIFQLEGFARCPEQTRAWLLWVQSQWADLPLGSQAQAVETVDAVRGDPEAILERLAPASGEAPPLEEAYLYLLELWRLGEAEAFFTQVERFRQRPGAAPAGPVLAMAAWRGGRSDLALELAAMSPACFLQHILHAEMALERGDLDAARAHWRMSLKLEPMQPLLVYKLHDSLKPAPNAALLERSRVHVAYYTFNKFQMTLDTLESLLESDIGPAGITLLNNGSTAFSPEELQAGVDSVRQGRPVHLVHLPTNIGAPAARNWLRCLPQCSEADYLANLDDDVLLPRDWLVHYLQDLTDNPGACCVGPLCVNPGALPTIQYVWRFFQVIGENKIQFTNNCPQFMDMGQFSLRRPCLSVMGCCHLFDMRRWRALNIPDFDIRFSPSQVDDLEHDMQIWKAGGQVWYNGLVRVVHRQAAGKQSPMSRAAWGSVLANHGKMEAKWSGGELAGVDDEVRAVDEAHWRAALETARPLLPEQARNLLATYGAA